MAVAEECVGSHVVADNINVAGVFSYHHPIIVGVGFTTGAPAHESNRLFVFIVFSSRIEYSQILQQTYIISRKT